MSHPRGKTSRSAGSARRRVTNARRVTTARADGIKSFAKDSGRSRPYYEATLTPLHALVFLLPMLVVYELAFPADVAATVGPIAAKAYLSELFASLGAAGRYLPSSALVVTLIVWQVLSREPWRVRPKVLAGMTIESVLFAVPLLVLGLQLDPVAAVSFAPPAVAGGVPGEGPGATGVVVDQLADVPWTGRLAVAFGAGVYEEFLFRMLGLAAVHVIIADVCRVPDRPAKVLAVLVTAIAFAVYHDLAPVGAGAGVAEGAGLNLGLAVFYVLAGVYLGGVYLMRGLGISVGAHATYNAIVLLLVA